MIVIFLMATLIIGGIYAYFSDVEQTTDNSFTAGTLDLKTNGADGVTATITATNMKPGDRMPTSGNASVNLTNVGSIDGSTLDINFTYVESDGQNPTEFPANMTADEFADELLVVVLNYGGTDLLPSISDGDADGVDMKEAASADLTGQTGINTGLSKNFEIAVQLKTSVGNDYQADGIDMTITFTLIQ